MIVWVVYNEAGFMEDSFIPKSDIKRMASIIMKTFILFPVMFGLLVQRRSLYKVHRTVEKVDS